MSPGSQEQLHDLIYTAPVQPELWRDVLERLVAGVGAESASVSRLSVVDGSGAAINTGTDPSALTDYFTYYAALNPLIRVDDPDRYAADWHPAILHADQSISREALERTEYYNDFLRPIRATHGMAVRLGLQGTDLSVIDLGRSRRGRFTDDEVAFVARVHPHLIRAHALTRQFEALRGLSAGLTEGLDEAAGAMLLLDGDGRLLHANAPAERLLVRDRRLLVEHGCLRAAEPAPADALAAAIAMAATRAWRQRTARAVTLHGADGGLLTLTVSPLRLPQATLFAHGAAVLVSVAEEAAGSLSHDRLASLYGLTPSEARLADALFQGLSVRAVAERRRVSIHTARAQLGSIFSKTHTHRQVDLVRLLGQSATR